MSAARLLQINASAGACLGLLIGVLVGLSASQVVATIVGSLAAIAAAFISFVQPAQPAQAHNSGDDNHIQDLVRLIAFCLGCLLGLFGGLFVRTHDWLSPSLAERYRILTGTPLSFSPAEAQQIIAFEETGYPIGSAIGSAVGPQRASVPKQERDAAPAASDTNVALVHSFLRDSPASACDELQATRNDPDPASVRTAFFRRNGKFAVAAEASDWIPPRDRKRFFNEVLTSLCPSRL